MRNSQRTKGHDGLRTSSQQEKRSAPPGWLLGFASLTINMLVIQVFITGMHSYADVSRPVGEPGPVNRMIVRDLALILGSNPAQRLFWAGRRVG
jgi:hypothetical protein